MILLSLSCATTESLKSVIHITNEVEARMDCLATRGRMDGLVALVTSR